MSPLEATLIMFGLMAVLVVLGLPLVFALGGSAVVVGYFLFGSSIFAITYSSGSGILGQFVLVAIPLFIFMGLILEASGIAENLYDTIYKWSGGFRGGLAIGTVAICTLIAAMTGVSATAAVTMGLVALPSMLKRGYNKRLVMGAIMAGSALGQLIPPSIFFVLFGLFANVSVGAFFAGGVFPGLLLAALFIIYIGIRAFLQPEIAPALAKEQRVNLKEKMLSLKGIILPILLIILVIGSIFSGAATPTEAAGVGTLGAIICAALTGKLRWSTLKKSSNETLRVSAMTIWIVMGAFAFASVYQASGGSGLIKDIITNLGVNRWIIFFIMQLSFFVLGCFLDPTTIIMITVPVYMPIIKALGFDPVWYGVIMCMNMEMAFLTPPFGFNLFFMRGVTNPKEISMGDIYVSAVPFIMLQAIGLVICSVFPQIVMWLPKTLGI